MESQCHCDGKVYLSLPFDSANILNRISNKISNRVSNTNLSLPISIFRLFLLPFALGCIGLFFLLGQICALGVAAVYGLIILGQKYVDRSGIQQCLLPLGDWLLICFSHLLLSLAFEFRVLSEKVLNEKFSNFSNFWMFISSEFQKIANCSS